MNSSEAVCGYFAEQTKHQADEHQADEKRDGPGSRTDEFHVQGESMPDQALPPGATPIDTDELLAAIGELYVQVRVLRRIVAQEQQQRAMAPNGVADAVHRE